MTVVIAPGVAVDVVRPGDRDALLRLFAACSPDTVRRRFFAPVRELPRRYLAGVLVGPPRVHDALVARYGDGLHLAGLASLVAAPGDPRTAELGVLVPDAWQRRGLGAALVEGLVRRAVERGVEELIASVRPDRAGLLRVLGRRLVPLGVVIERDCLTGRYRLEQEVWGDRDAPWSA